MPDIRLSGRISSNLPDNLGWADIRPDNRHYKSVSFNIRFPDSFNIRYPAKKVSSPSFEVLIVHGNELSLFKDQAPDTAEVGTISNVL